jgi:hypothetical protein
LYSGFVKPLVTGAVHEQVCFEPYCMTVVAEESDDESTVWPLGKTLRLCVCNKVTTDTSLLPVCNNAT